VERYRKCVLIRDGVERLREFLGDLFGGDGPEAASRLDVLSVGAVTTLLGGP
jgi:hypothetical protein